MARFVSGIAAEVPATHVHPTAQVLGQTLIEGAHTRIGAGAHIENSYVCNAVVEPGAWLVDSVLMGALEGPRRHARPGFAARWAIHQPSPAVVGAAARIVRATIRDSSIGAGSRCTDAFVGDSTIGPGNELTEVYATGVESGAHVRARGPTELSEAWLGHHAVIDACGYFEGVFSNDFYVLEFDAGSGRLAVREVLDVPHVSRYGMNTINSTNSGSLLDQPGGLLASLGRHRGLWQDCLLSHEPMILGPCCWVAGWTKVIGKSAAVHASAAELLGDTLATHLLPFSVAGLDGPSVSGLVLPGERHDGPAPRRRQPAWVFTYAPGAVIAAVQRVAGALGDCALADRLHQGQG